MRGPTTKKIAISAGQSDALPEGVTYETTLSSKQNMNPRDTKSTAHSSCLLFLFVDRNKNLDLMSMVSG